MEIKTNTESGQPPITIIMDDDDVASMDKYEELDRKENIILESAPRAVKALLDNDDHFMSLMYLDGRDPSRTDIYTYDEVIEALDYVKAKLPELRKLWDAYVKDD